MGVVEHRQGLKRRVCSRPLYLTLVTVAGIKNQHGWRWNGSFYKNIHTSAIQIFSVVLHISGQTSSSRSRNFPQTFRLVRLHTWSTNFRIEQARSSQNVVSYIFCWNTHSGASRQILVFWVNFLVFIFYNRRLHISGGSDNLFHQTFDIPAILFEITSQPIQ